MREIDDTPSDVALLIDAAAFILIVLVSVFLAFVFLCMIGAGLHAILFA